jgi:hypothetical protein
VLYKLASERHEEAQASQPGQGTSSGQPLKMDHHVNSYADFDPDRSEESDESSEHAPGRRSVRVTLYGLKQDSEILRIC